MGHLVDENDSKSLRQIPYVFIKHSDYNIYPMRVFFGSIWVSKWLLK